MKRCFGLVLAAGILLVLGSNVMAEDPPPVVWARQMGSSNNDVGSALSLDAPGNIYIAGRTEGDLAATNEGYDDTFLAKYDSGGNLLWTRQSGTSGSDRNKAVATDASPDIYVAGETQGALAGAHVGYFDAFLRKYDGGGNIVWSRQFGTTSYDGVNAVTTDGSGNIYVVGATFGDLDGTNAGSGDVFLRKYDGSGNVLWARQHGSSISDNPRSVALDGSGNIYVAGFDGSVSTEDVFLWKYDSGGNRVWTRSIGSSSRDQARGMALDGAGGIYVTGWTEGDLAGPNEGGGDVFLCKYDTAGNLLWSRQRGLSGSEYGNDVAVDALGDIYITGWTDGDLGAANAGASDIFVIKYDSDGDVLWTSQFGSSSGEDGTAVGVDTSGGIYITGVADGSFGGPTAGGADVFLVKLPEPASATLLLIGLPWLMRRRGNRPRARREIETR